ncbi:benenodin family lasso peptide [Sphingobium lactosutens]|uniref:Benenodin family lasso peptide n=1 Tax=Sphingobium lactosutens DS20 TaxID=1331060 RepID=T0II37_9SPHN|nr:benenodin family lasso peptide [Sphingobium lactosutens]EQB11375.1 hypothetical protein RLDS_23520 [Sphingobium lactosutens DS20]
MLKEVTMTEHNEMLEDEAIELGIASVETKGNGLRVIDGISTLQPLAGISDD